MKNPWEAMKGRKRSCCFLLSSLAWQCQWSHFRALFRSISVLVKYLPTTFYWQWLLCFGFCLHPPELQIHTHVLDSFILCGFTSSKVSLRPAEESFLLQRDPPALWELLNTQNKISHFFIKLSWAFSGIKTSRLGNVPYLASLNSTSGNLLEQKDGRGGGNIIFCLIGFD